MKDGQKIPVGVMQTNYTYLTDLGWRVFEIPEEMLDEIASWLHDNNFVACSWTDDNIYPSSLGENNFFIGVFTLSIRRYADATLFRLSWPECIPFRKAVIQ